MASDMTIDVFAEFPFGKAALDKFGDVSENFRLYEAGWIDNSREIMEVKGADFRVAKSGDNKGKLSIIVNGSIRKCFVTANEMASYT